MTQPLAFQNGIREIPVQLRGPGDKILCQGFMLRSGFETAFDRVVSLLKLGERPSPQFSLKILRPPKTLAPKWRTAVVGRQDGYEKVREMATAAIAKLSFARHSVGLGFKLDEVVVPAMEL